MQAVILAGGLGTRLRPFTQAIPKPLLPIGETTVLEIQIRNLARHGFRDIYIATNYKADYVEAFLGDGTRFDVRLFYSKEEQPLGTCGPLSLLKDRLTEPFLVTNGDILSLIDHRKLYAFGKKHGTTLTVATKETRTPFNFGKVLVENDIITGIEEKKDLLVEVLAGIYYMQPEVFEFVPDDQFFGMDDLILTMLDLNKQISRYLVKEYWLDIGAIEDYNEAQQAYEEHFRHSMSVGS